MSKIIPLALFIYFLSMNTYAQKIKLFYAETFDAVCSIKSSYPIKPAWQQELKNRLPIWQKLWNDEGDLLLQTSMRLVGKPFDQYDYKPALSVCSFPSMSAPLIINTRYALKTFVEKPITDDVFISIIMHEILHNYLDSFLPAETPLLIKYRTESKGVLSHLHLFALQKAAYLTLGWQSKLDAVIAKDQNLPNGDYKRAWEIINKDEDYSSFLAELKKRY